MERRNEPPQPVKGTTSSSTSYHKPQEDESLNAPLKRVLKCSSCKTGKAADFFCDNCQELFCSGCIGQNEKHQNHAYVPIQDAYLKHEAHLVDSTIHPLNREIANLLDIRQSILDVRKGVLKQVESTQSDIRSLVAELRVCLDQAEKKLNTDLDTISKINLAVLDKQLNNIDASLDQMKKCKNHIEAFVEQTHDVGGSPLEIIAKKSELMFHAQCAISEAQTATIESPLKKPSHIHLVRENKINDAYANIGHIVSLECVRETNLCISYEDIPIAEHLSSVVLSFVLPDGQLFPVPSTHIECSLTPSSGDTEAYRIPCTIMQYEDAFLYRVSFTPLIRGLHQLSVQVKGDERIRVSAIPVSVSVLMRNNSIGSIKVPNPTGIAVDSQGRLIVSNCFKMHLDLFKKHGKKFTPIPQKGSTLKLHYPQGLALSSNGTILVSDCMNNCIREFTFSGDHIRMSGFINRPLGITVSKTIQKIFVIESKRNSVHVLQPDLSFSYSFCIDQKNSKLGKLSKPHDVAIDSNGFVYVTDYGNCRVVKFTVEGQVISAFDGQGSSLSQLRYPSGITIDHNILYINQDGSDKVKVFNTDGQFVTALKKNSVWTSSSNWLNGITIDTNTGILYIAQYGDGKVDLR